jgi:hypothetical protein
MLESLGKIHRYFEDSLPNNKIEPLEPFILHGNLAMACYTRYFLPYRYCKSISSHPFGPGVDPEGVLRRLGGNSYIHTEDNAVQYLGKTNHAEKFVKHCILGK